MKVKIVIINVSVFIIIRFSYLLLIGDSDCTKMVITVVIHLKKLVNVLITTILVAEILISSRQNNNESTSKHHTIERRQGYCRTIDISK